jgi:hypothetical protein
MAVMKTLHRDVELLRAYSANDRGIVLWKYGNIKYKMQDFN